MSDRLAPSASDRHVFHASNGTPVYSWDQTISEVNIFVVVPPGVRAKDISCVIKINHLCFGLIGNPPFLDMDMAGQVKVSESYWTLEDGTLHITLTKSQEGEPWPSALQGHGLDAASQQVEQQRLLLERFQVEHPGFDFSGATVNGEAPNARTFMGGIKRI